VLKTKIENSHDEKEYRDKNMCISVILR